MGLELYEKALREVAGNAAFDIGVSPALPFGWTKRAWDLLQSGAGYAATMLERYVNRCGVEFVSPSNVVTGGTSPGTGSVNDLAAQI